MTRIRKTSRLKPGYFCVQGGPFRLIFRPECVILGPEGGEKPCDRKHNGRRSSGRAGRRWRSAQRQCSGPAVRRWVIRLCSGRGWPLRRRAHAKAREYTGGKRAGWAEPGKRTRENHAILIPRQEAVDTANNLATAIYAKEVYITWAMNLRGFMVQLATGEHDAVTCRECGGIFRAGWMNGKCPYCEAKQAATRYVDGMREAAGK